ncbi:transcription factor E2F6-like isoform X1 [Cottoperca gobio]|uniref:Transcription factor E2F6-like isoform X1 n=1 Tax=Cottoperca gobio TaxID=56716 RepID=A0A6J2PC76_COTGO|nr:transcription factor E2F6-like isoform X1 [Cottoperca gobio]XP_029282770.1 transcription factor E2F6-like isoform X1 [Cottoperca gobio]XP_029282772.1 transcription factor E2F6-like isoform X1 [Cottoperca gobio]
MDNNRSPRIIGKRCVVWGCGAVSKSGYGMFLWPKDDQISRLWTRQVRRTRAHFAGPGKPGSMKPTICGQHFERSCFEQSTMLAKEMGFKKNFKLNADAVPTILPRPPPSPPPKRRRNAFPKRERAKVWLTALREQQQDATEQQFACEDHFLPEDISTNRVNGDASPIVPLYLDGLLGPVSPRGAESSKEEEEEESGGDAPPAADPPQQNPGGGLENLPEAERTRCDVAAGFVSLPSASLRQRKRPNTRRRGERGRGRVLQRQKESLGRLTQRFLELLLATPDGALDLRDVAVSLQTQKRRVYEITHVLSSLNLLQKDSTNWVKWIGKSPISSFLCNNQRTLRGELDALKRMEAALDGLITRCARQLFHMTDNVENASSAYVTHEDIRRLRDVQQQTLIIVKAPEETQLEIPEPQEDIIQVHLKAGEAISVLTCEMGSEPGFFLTLEESRVRTTALHSEASCPHGGVQRT